MRSSLKNKHENCSPLPGFEPWNQKPGCEKGRDAFIWMFMALIWGGGREVLQEFMRFCRSSIHSSRNLSTDSFECYLWAPTNLEAIAEVVEKIHLHICTCMKYESTTWAGIAKNRLITPRCHGYVNCKDTFTIKIPLQFVI